MARPRNPRRNEAMRIYLESNGEKKLIDLADLLSVPYARIRKWKFEDKWDEELKKPLEERNIPRRKTGPPYGSKNALGNKGGKGGPVGNQHAKGHGPPKRSHNALKTGEYATIWLDTLSIEEQCLLSKIDTDPLSQIEKDIMLYEIRERRMLENIRHLKENAAKGSLDEKITRIIPNDDGSHGGKVTEIQNTRKLLTDKLCAAEDALTRVQERKLKAIQAKHRMMQELGRYNMVNESLVQQNLSNLTDEELKNLAKFAGV